MKRFILFIAMFFIIGTISAQGLGKLVKKSLTNAIVKTVETAIETNGNKNEEKVTTKANEKTEKTEKTSSDNLCYIWYTNNDKDTVSLYFDKYKGGGEKYSNMYTLCEYYRLNYYLKRKHYYNILKLSQYPDCFTDEQLYVNDSTIFGITFDKSRNQITIIKIIDNKIRKLIPELKDEKEINKYRLIGDTLYKSAFNESYEIGIDDSIKGEPFLLIADNQIKKFEMDKKIFDYQGGDKFEVALLAISNLYFTVEKNKLNLIKKGEEEKKKIEENEYTKWKETTKYKANVSLVITTSKYECPFCYKECTTKFCKPKSLKEPNFSGLKNEKYYKRAYQTWDHNNLYPLIDGYDQECKEKGCGESKSGNHTWKLINTYDENKTFVFELPTK